MISRQICSPFKGASPPECLCLEADGVVRHYHRGVHGPCEEAPKLRGDVVCRLVDESDRPDPFGNHAGYGKEACTHAHIWWISLIYRIDQEYTRGLAIFLSSLLDSPRVSPNVSFFALGS